MKKLTIRGKVRLAFAFVVLFAMVLGALGWLQANSLEQSILGWEAIETNITVAFKEAHSIKLLFAAIVFLPMLSGLVVSSLTNRSIAKTIRQQAKDLFEAADQVVSASSQVSSASQSLAEGASEQAASLEESSSAMEQMTSMVKSNAESTKEAARLVELSRQSMKTSHRSLKNTKETMSLISASGEQIAKIIKTIDLVKLFVETDLSFDTQQE